MRSTGSACIVTNLSYVLNCRFSGTELTMEDVLARKTTTVLSPAPETKLKMYQHKSGRNNSQTELFHWLFSMTELSALVSRWLMKVLNRPDAVSDMQT